MEDRDPEGVMVAAAAFVALIFFVGLVVGFGLGKLL